MNKKTINIKRLSFVYTRRQQLSEKYRAKFIHMHCMNRCIMNKDSRADLEFIIMIPSFRCKDFECVYCTCRTHVTK